MILVIIFLLLLLGYLLGKNLFAVVFKGFKTGGGNITRLMATVVVDWVLLYDRAALP